MLSTTTPPNATKPGAQGVLRRYQVEDADRAEEILWQAQVNDWDVWHATPSHVDVYFPAGAELVSEYPLPKLYTDTNIYSNIPSQIPLSEGSSHSAQFWQLSSLANTTFHANYRTLDEIYAFMHDLVAEYPDRVSIVNIGYSDEGREMYALEISATGAASHLQSHDQKLPGSSKRLGFVITGAQHAREWVATASAIYLAHALVANASEQFSLAPLLDDYNFFVVPVPNPDGYVYTWEHDRYWYKNRQTLEHGSVCTGIDMNRNWGYKWKANPKYLAPEASMNASVVEPTNKGKTADPCSHWYPGQRAFQAVEVANMASYFKRLPRLRAYLDLRSYGQMLSVPFSYSCKQTPKDAEDQMEAIHGAAHMVRRTHGATFSTGSLCSTLYRAPGNVVDWMYASLDIKWSFAAHLRDTGTYGFSLPARWIRPVGEETTQMLEYLARFIVAMEKTSTPGRPH